MIFLFWCECELDNFLPCSSSYFLPLFGETLPFVDKDRFFLCESERSFPLFKCGIGLPFFANEIFFFVSSDLFFPLLFSEILFNCSDVHFLPNALGGFSPPSEIFVNLQPIDL